MVLEILYPRLTKEKIIATLHLLETVTFSVMSISRFRLDKSVMLPGYFFSFFKKHTWSSGGNPQGWGCIVEMM